MDNNSFNKLEKKLDKNWNSINIAISNSEIELNNLSEILNKDELKILSEDFSFVVFGSLARKEFTIKSDIDWTLLVDGQTDIQHQNSVIEMQKVLKNAGKIDPGATGTFGGITFSHDLVHYIGGAEDSNKNMTRRLLMLLESRPIIINGNSKRAYDSVIKNIIKRYLNLDFSNSFRFPRFLLNDLVRYWRTICVDFAAKQWVQKDNKWIIRNVKLRFSRKLLFVSGLLMCFSLYKKDDLDENDAIEILLDFVNKTPIEILADYLLNNNLTEIGDNIFTSYSYFLEILNDEEKGKHLESIDVSDIYKDGVFKDVREMSRKFNEALIKMFFDEETELKQFNRSYGVF